MLLIQAKDLECNGISHKSAKSICFQGNTFVRGLTFSKRLRQAAVDLYREEIAAGKSCLIVDDETHVTLWHQTNAPGTIAAAEADIPNQKTVQAFIQSFAAAKRTTLSQPELSTEASSGQRQAANITASTTAAMAMANRGSNGATANQPEKLQSPSLKLDPPLPLTAVSAKPLAVKSSPKPTQQVLTNSSDPFSSPYLGPLRIPAPSTYPVAPSHQNPIGFYVR